MAALLNVFGCPLDPEIGEDRLAMKRAYAALRAQGLPSGAPTDPAAVLKPYAARLSRIRDGGTVAVDGRMRPVPDIDDPHALTAEANLAFVRRDGCRLVAERVRDHVRAACSGRIPLMIGIDHSASGGAIEALSARHGADNLVLIVMDAHLDAVPGDIRQGLLAYARAHPGRFGPLADRLAAAHDAAEYDCGSFLNDLVARGVVLPQQLVVLGCADLPAPALRAIDDVRVRRYVAHLDALLARGMRVVPRDALLAADDVAALIRSVLAGYRGSAVYVSVDMDVGAHAALTGVRFLEHRGMPAACMLEAFHAVLHEATARGNRLAGLDLMEFDFYRAGASADGRRDATYDIALHLITMAAERLEQTQGRIQ